MTRTVHNMPDQEAEHSALDRHTGKSTLNMDEMINKRPFRCLAI